MPKGLQGFQKGHKPFWKTHSDKTKEKLRLSKLGNKNPMFGKSPWNKGKSHLPNEKNPSWKGSNVGYYGLHRWIRKHFGTPQKCEKCKKDGLTGHKINWASRDNKYTRNKKDWIRLCITCHRKLDKKSYLGKRGHYKMRKKE